ncbi:MAG TPA: ankyrin repeat domain-containing protein [Chthonomonadaceae bacterium]|nr:ankyrin repeat domain-containing protein [Chthonomonadaceae bacterium]
MGNLEAIEALLDAGVNVDAPVGKEGGTPLQEAVVEGHYEAVRLLLDRGANINAVSNCNDTALSIAAFRNDTAIGRLLLERGARTDIPQCYRDWTPLQCAALIGWSEFVRLLLEYGANTEAKDRTGDTALLIALDCMHYDRRDNNYPETVRLLLKHGANVNVLRNDGQTPLLRVVQRCNDFQKEFVQILLDFHADVNRKDADGWTALNFALAYQQKDIEQMLCQAGAKTSEELSSQLSTPPKP